MPGTLAGGYAARVWAGPPNGLQESPESQMRVWGGILKGYFPSLAPFIVGLIGGTIGLCHVRQTFPVSLWALSVENAAMQRGAGLLWGTRAGLVSLDLY